MKTVGISLADPGITACLFDGEDTSLVPLEKAAVSSPGYACLGDRGLLLGEQAIGSYRLSPSRSTDRFWDQLSLTPSALPVRRKPVSHAHLAYLHLKMIWERIQSIEEDLTGVGLALPGYLLDTDPQAEERLGILLGIIADLGIPLSVILPLELAGLHYHAQPEVIDAPVTYHLDIHQYQTHLYRCSGEKDLHSRVVGEIPDCGFHQILETLHSRAAQRFLGETAFDVTEDSEVEQNFFEQVRELLQGGHHGVKSISVQFENQVRNIQIADDHLEQMLQVYIKRISDMVYRVLSETPDNGSSGSICLQLSGRATMLPGLALHLQRHAPIPFQVVAAEKGAAAAGAARIASRFQPAADLQHTPVFATWKRPRPATAAAAPDSSNTLYPTHLLYRSIAYPIPQSGLMQQPGSNGHPLPAEVIQAFHLPWEGKDLRILPTSDASLKINGRSARGEWTLKTGDTLTASLDGKRYELHCIHIPGHAAG